ncbi:MAG: DUF6279 family lipoprotein [Aquabacterium sp.]
MHDILPASMRASHRAPLTPRLRLAALLLASLLLFIAGCSIVRTIYNQAGNLIYWQVNRAFHLEDEQSDQLRRNLHGFFRWHRQAELPLYASLLQRGAREAQGSISPELVCERRAEFEKVGRRSLDHAIPMMAELLRSLQPYQLAHLKSFLDDFNEDFQDDFLQEDKADRDEAWGEFALKWAEFFYGRMSRAQRDQLIRGVVTGPFSAQDAYGELLRLEREITQIARKAQAERLSQAQVEQALRSVVQQTFEPGEEPRKSKLARWISAGCVLGSTVHNGTTQAQRDKVTERLTDWEKDVRILATQL